MSAGTLYAALEAGALVRTDDGGDTWSSTGKGLDHRYVWGLAVPADDPGTVVVSAARGARSADTVQSAESSVYRRTGDGHWERLPVAWLETYESRTPRRLAVVGN